VREGEREGDREECSLSSSILVAMVGLNSNRAVFLSVLSS